MLERVGVCSWSLRPGSPSELVELVLAADCRSVQLALEPVRTGAWDEDELFDRLGEAGIGVSSAMMEMAGEDYSSIESITRTGGVRPDATWGANERAAEENAAIVARRGIGLVTFHAGFLPHEPGDAERDRMLSRLSRLAAIYGDAGARIGLETGQEDAPTLLGVLGELDGMTGGAQAPVGVNFDPANMLLYGTGDPVPAFRELAQRVVQIHIKDAVASGDPGAWGEEVVVGTGGVDWSAFFGAVREAGLGEIGMIIEREAGESRVDDVREAFGCLAAHAVLLGSGDAAEGASS